MLATILGEEERTSTWSTMIGDPRAEMCDQRDMGKPFACDQCEYRGAKMENLERHKHTHGEREFKCSSCDKAYFTLKSLQAHEKLHDETKAHVCEHCEKRFSRPSHLAIHVRTHLKMKPFECPECDYAATHRSALKAHMTRKHSTGPASICGDCGKSFTSGEDYERHLKTHDPNRETFSCQQCDKVYYRRAELTIHHRVVHEKVKFTCEFCAADFGYRNALNRHLRTVHFRHEDPCAARVFPGPL